jgi:hypothetical protein
MGCGILYRMVVERNGLSATLATRRTDVERVPEVMRQNFGSRNINISPIEKCAHLKHLYFHNTEAMGAVHHALSRRPLSSGAHSNTIDLFPTASLMSGTLFLNDIIRGARKDYFFVQSYF